MTTQYSEGRIRVAFDASKYGVGRLQIVPASSQGRVVVVVPVAAYATGKLRIVPGSEEYGQGRVKAVGYTSRYGQGRVRVYLGITDSSRSALGRVRTWHVRDPLPYGQGRARVYQEPTKHTVGRVSILKTAENYTKGRVVIATIATPRLTVGRVRIRTLIMATRHGTGRVPIREPIVVRGGRGDVTITPIDNVYNKMFRSYYPADWPPFPWDTV